MVRVSPHAAAAVVPTRPNRALAASSPAVPPIVRSSVVAASLSLFSIMVTERLRSYAVSSRPWSWARSSSAARMSTLTMLAVAYVPFPYTAPAPTAASSTATDTLESPASGATASASSASRSTSGSSLVTTGAGGPGAGESAADDTEATGPGPGSDHRPTRYIPPATEPASRNTVATDADSTDVRIFVLVFGIGRVMEPDARKGTWQRAVVHLRAS